MSDFVIAVGLLAVNVSSPFGVNVKLNVSSDTDADHPAFAPCTNDAAEPGVKESMCVAVTSDFVIVATEPPLNALI